MVWAPPTCIVLLSLVAENSSSMEKMYSLWLNTSSSPGWCENILVRIRRVNIWLFTEDSWLRKWRSREIIWRPAREYWWQFTGLTFDYLHLDELNICSSKNKSKNGFLDPAFELPTSKDSKNESSKFAFVCFIHRKKNHQNWSNGFRVMTSQKITHKLCAKSSEKLRPES